MICQFYLGRGRLEPCTGLLEGNELVRPRTTCSAAGLPARLALPRADTWQGGRARAENLAVSLHLGVGAALEGEEEAEGPSGPEWEVKTIWVRYPLPPSECHR